MRFLLLIKFDESRWLAESQLAKEKIYAEYRTLLTELGSSGRLVEADQCTASDTARSVQVRDGQLTVVKASGGRAEQVAGFILIDVASREEAIEISARVPSAREGLVEVWPISPRQNAQASWQRRAAAPIPQPPTAASPQRHENLDSSLTARERL